MKFPEKAVPLKDGRSCILRPTVPDDALAMIEYMAATAGETPFLLRYPDEISYTEEGEREILGRIYGDPSSVMMAAEVEGKIAGSSMIQGNGAKRKTGHRCSLSIALYKDYWQLGIGTAMIAYLFNLARQIGYAQMDLEVVAENTRAQALYGSCGFVASGRRHNALRFDDGSFHDEILMYKEL